MWSSACAGTFFQILRNPTRYDIRTLKPREFLQDDAWTHKHDLTKLSIRGAPLRITICNGRAFASTPACCMHKAHEGRCESCLLHVHLLACNVLINHICTALADNPPRSVLREQLQPLQTQGRSRNACLGPMNLSPLKAEPFRGMRTPCGCSSIRSQHCTVRSLGPGQAADWGSKNYTKAGSGCAFCRLPLDWHACTGLAPS